MSTDNLYMHTFSIRGSTCAPCSPYSFTDLLHQRKHTVHCISSTCWFLEREYVGFRGVSARSVDFHFNSLYLSHLHKTSHVASVVRQNAYLTTSVVKMPLFLRGISPLDDSYLIFSIGHQFQIHHFTPSATQNSVNDPGNR